MATDTDSPTLELATRLQRSAARLARQMRPGAAAGLSPARLGILAGLRRAGAVTATVLAGDLGVQPQSLTRLLADLETRGLIARRPDERDRRQSLIAPTEAGLQLLGHEMQRRRLALARAIGATLSPTEQDLLRLAAGLMDRLGTVLAAPDHPPP